MNTSLPHLSPDAVLLIAGVCIVLGVVLLVLPRSRKRGKLRLAVALALLLGSFSGVLVWAGVQETRLAEWSGGERRVDARASAATFSARTDCGRTIPLYRVETGPGYREAETPEDLPGRDIARTAPASAESNCHGWVFADGHYWIDSDQIDDILEDNCYAEVSTPQVDDVIVYRTAGGVAHTGIVRQVSADGSVVVESKWGTQGRFLHAPADQPFWRSWSYYHSPRQGHRLDGLATAPYPGEQFISAGQQAPGL